MLHTAGVSKKVILVFGLLHLSFSLFGLYVTLVTLRSVGFLRNEPLSPLAVEFFYGMTVINVLLVIALGLAGYRLLRSGVSAVPFSNAVLFAEIAYLSLLPALMLFPSLRHSVASSLGIGNVGIAVQGLLAYPIISLILMRKLRT